MYSSSLDKHALSTADACVRGAYRHALHEQWIRLSIISAWVGLVLVPAGASLDYIVYPDRFPLFAGLRVLAELAIAAGLVAYSTQPGRAHVRLITFSWLLVVQATICYMIFATEGANSTYYAGLSLAVLAIGIVLPTSLVEAIFFCCATMFFYAAAVLLHGPSIDTAIFFNNAYFLLLTCVITTLATYFNSLRRFSEFSLRYELDLRNRELADLDRLKSQFLANISHELRTPLTLILAPLADLLRDGADLPEPLRAMLTTARDNGLRLLRLVNNLLEVIRLEEGKADLEQQPVHIDHLVSAIIDSMAPLAAARRIQLVKALRQPEVIVSGDYHALEKIFLNLLTNAIKFTDSGGRIVVRSSACEEGTAIDVQDTGIGISERDLPYVFDRFRQADSSSTRKYQGTGLGLALVKELAERQGGSVRAVSRLNEGTTMTIVLPTCEASGPRIAPPSTQAGDDDPLASIHRAAELAAALPSDLPSAEPEPGAGRDSLPRVLVVEDEPDMRRYLVEILSPAYRVLQAGDGRISLELARRLKPELMVVDLMLPELDGLEVCRRLKADPDTRGIKLVLLTARVDEDAKLTALASGADDFLTKPFSSIEVKTRLKNLLQTANLERDLQLRNHSLQETLSRLQRTQAQLIQSEKLNALGSLSAGLLHEVNNPLNYALTALKLARRQAAKLPDGDIDEMLGDIDDGMQRIRRIVTDLRAFAYPSEGDHQPFLLHEAVGHAIQFTAHDHEAIRIHNRIPPQLQLSGSRSHIVQVLINLLSNSGKAIATAGRPGEILIDGEPLEGRYRLRVRDNGVGMDAATLSRVFDPFFTTRDVGQGMGLGLSVCHTIIGNHGGQLSAASEPGAGTEFFFDLPLATIAPAMESA